MRIGLLLLGLMMSAMLYAQHEHPHDLISELSVSYAHALSPRSDLLLYLAYPGEPALGPAAYVHRI